MGEITDYIQLYVEDSGMIEDKLSEIMLNLTANIQDQLYPGHGYIRGDLHDSIQSDITAQNKTIAVIRAYSEVEYAPWVNDGHRLRNNEWWEGYHFMEKGLEATVAMYR